MFSLAIGRVRTQKRVRVNHGKRAIGVRAIEVLLYFRRTNLPKNVGIYQTTASDKILHCLSFSHHEQQYNHEVQLSGSQIEMTKYKGY